jgi:D-inositol-3-phosphate glycosyltransferase
MNIAMLSYHTCPLATLGGKDTGGMNVYVRELTHHLGCLGVHVDVFTRSQDEHVPHVLHDLGYGNRVVHIPAGPEVPLSKQELTQYINDFANGIEKFADEKGLKYDLIHSHYWMSGMAAQILKTDWKIPVIQMFHTLGEMKNRIARNDSERESQARIDGEKLIMDMADRIIISTPAEQSQMEFLYRADSQKMIIIPPGVDTSRFYKISNDEARAVIGVPAGDCMILYVGRIEPLKGVETLIRAISIMEKNGIMHTCPHYLTIIGGDPEASPENMNAEMKRLQDLSTELGINDLIIFLGKRSQDTLPYYYSAAQIVVVPSHYESFGMVALEAMACGTPVVASQVGGLAFLVQEGVTGYVIPDDDPQILVDRLTRLIKQPDLRKQMGQQAIEVAKSYDWTKISARILDVYKDLLNIK